MNKEMYMTRVHRMDYGEYRESQLGLLYDLSKICHEKDDPRKNGDSYYTHPVAVSVGCMDTQETLTIREWRATGTALIHDCGKSLA